MKTQNDNTVLRDKIQGLKKFIPIPIVIACVTSIITWVKLESHQSFLELWLPFYTMVICVVLPLAILIMKGIQYVIDRRLRNQSKRVQSAVFGLLMASIMGTLMTGTALFTQNTFISFTVFTQQWGQGVLKASPFILTVGLLIGLVIKPLIERKKAVAILQETRKPL